MLPTEAICVGQEVTRPDGSPAASSLASVTSRKGGDGEGMRTWYLVHGGFSLSLSSSDSKCLFEIIIDGLLFLI